MDDTDIERLYFATPLLTPHLSDSNASDYFDLDCSYSSRDHQQRMANIPKDLQKVADLCLQLEKFHKTYLDDNNESESDVQDQRPTEAADASEIASNTQTTTINTIDKHDDDSFTIVQENNPCEESFSSVMSDTELIPIEEPFKRPVLNYSRSLCLAYTETSIIKETLTTTSDISLEFTGIVAKDKNDIGHILISYNHSTAIICSKIAKQLKNLNYNVWIDRDNISGDIFTSMASAVENCFVVLMAVNEPYYQSRYCRLEAEYSVERNKASIPMLMQASYKSRGWLGIINGSKLQIDFSTISFDEAFNLLVREIEAVRISLGADENFQNAATPINNQLITTMDNSWFHSQNVQDWSTNDVIEWLNREKLDMFEDALRNFTGKTLWQLYKIKLNSPTDYYRMIESLLFPTIPLRIFHNLTFDSALESIFSSFIQAMRR
ncbi:unnamed protein product [Rotaria socialis]